MSPSPPSMASSAKDPSLEGQLVITQVSGGQTAPASNRKGWSFWLVFVAVSISTFVAAMELTAVSTALPTITSALHGDDFTWIGTAYPLASTALLPASGALSEIFGRRYTMLIALGLFTIGSALCGSAESMSWLIAGRTVQGAGGGAIQAVSSIIISDLVSLKERGVYNSAIGLTWGLASAIGPLVGGSLAKNGQWRWIFYLNLPISGLSAVLVFLFLKLRTPGGTIQEKLARMDWLGNILIIGSTTACTIGLTWGGVQFPWNSAKVLVPFILGLCGIGLFLLYEVLFAKHPMVPLSLMSNRTTLSGYIQIFVVPIVILAVNYYLSTYYQACKGASPIRAGVLALGATVPLAPAMIICGASITITKSYRVQLWLGWVFLMIALGTLSTVESTTELSKPVGYSALYMISVGMINAAAYFPVLAPLPVSENARALSFFVFCRTFAGVWGISIGGAVLQNQLAKRLPKEFLALLPKGVTLAYSAIPTINGLPEPLRTDVRQAFAESTVVIWQVLIGIAGIGLLSSLFMKALPLHTQMDDRWGLEENRSNRRGEEIPMKDNS